MKIRLILLNSLILHYIKAASASLTDDSLLLKKISTGKPLIISTGMSTPEEINRAVSINRNNDLLIAHSTSSYPCKLEELNLKVIQTKNLSRTILSAIRT